jgi:hypothetical protein
MCLEHSLVEEDFVTLSTFFMVDRLPLQLLPRFVRQLVQSCSMFGGEWTKATFAEEFSFLLFRGDFCLLDFSFLFGFLLGHEMHSLVLQGHFPIGAGGVVALERESCPIQNGALAFVSFSWEECC